MNQDKTDRLEITRIQWTGLVILRMCVGWHLLYEGLIKITDPGWSSAPYLQESNGIFSDIFKTIAENPGWLSFVDILNPWMLMFSGFALIAGFLTKTASYTAMILLLIFYLAQPPFGDATDLVVNAVLIEAALLFVLALFPTGKIIGFDRLIYLSKRK